MKLSMLEIKPPSKTERRRMGVDEIGNALDIKPAEAQRIARAIEDLIEACEMEEDEAEEKPAAKKKRSIADIMKGK